MCAWPTWKPRLLSRPLAVSVFSSPCLYALVEVSVVNLSEVKSDITAICVCLQIPNIMKVLPFPDTVKRPAFWLVDLPIVSCAAPVEAMRPMLQPRFPTCLLTMASRGARYITNSTLYVFVYLPLLAGPLGLSPPQNRWCSPMATATPGTNGVVHSCPPGSSYEGNRQDEIPVPEVAGRLHRLSVFLRAKVNSIPHVILNDPTLKEYVFSLNALWYSLLLCAICHVATCRAAESVAVLKPRLESSRQRRKTQLADTEAELALLKQQAARTSLLAYLLP